MGEKNRERKKRKEEEEEEEEAKKGMDSSKELCMELYGTMVLYGIKCILDCGRDFHGFQT